MSEEKKIEGVHTTGRASKKKEEGNAHAENDRPQVVGEKLMKVLQGAGVDSRRNIRQNIHDGLYKVNNRVITDPNFLVDINKDTIREGEKKLKIKIEHKVYYLFHKPYGVVTTLEDPEGRPTIKDFITRIKERVFPVGRLDYHSEGLIFLTNDGELTNFIISAKNKIPKVYMIKIKGVLKEEERKRLMTKGIHLEGTRVKPLRIDFVKKTTQGNSWIKVTIVEGKKHILRKVFKYSGHPVEKLKRTAIGTFQLKKLPSAHVYHITPEELAHFKKTYHYTE
jgi:23S rRNA pseudouridine2605 synthase